MDELLNIPIENLRAYAYIYKIEVGLREFIIKSLEKIDPKWWKHRIPSELQNKMNSGRLQEKSIKWIDLIPHHPLYYLDFPELEILIEQKNNWNDVFKKSFSDKDVTVGTFHKIVPLRNKIAHNRKLSSNEVKTIENAYQFFEKSIGHELYEKMLFKPTLALDIPEQLTCLYKLSKECYELCKKYSILPPLEYWKDIERSWWFDSTYLDHDITPITQLMTVFIDYSLLPRYRGSGHLIEEWVRKQNVDEIFSISSNSFSLLLEVIEK